MKTRKRILSTILFAIVAMLFPLTAFATDKIPEVTIPESTSGTIPPVAEISDNPDYSEDFASSIQSDNVQLLTRSSSLSGSSSISKLSSTSVRISGSSVCAPSNPAVSVTLVLQAYYSGSWHSLKSIGKSTSGTSVSLSKTYTVTSEYYYRVRGYHSLADGTSCTTCTSAIWVN